jgi:stage III sporulation protein SpoIIIAA
MTTEAYTITDNLDDLLAVLPNGLKNKIAPDDRGGLIEIVLDLGRKPEARFANRYEYLREETVTREELDFVESKLGAFGDDNRAGLPATLHRISAMRNRRGVIVGLTLRVGRAVSGIVDILRDLIESGQSILLMGRPGLGKTTLLREMARVLADELGKRVVIVDTSNEIAGDGDVPHPAIGRARRMQVPRVAQQHDVMIEAVENHMPEVIVIDEIGRSEEALASRTIAERGVQLIATVHGNTLENLLANPTMSDLVGGIQAVTLSDEEARRRGTQKTVLERKAPATFDVIVEMISRDEMAVRRPVDEIVDAILRGHDAPPEIRRRDEHGEIVIEAPPPRPEYSAASEPRFSSNERGRNSRGRRRSGRYSDDAGKRNGRYEDRKQDVNSRPERGSEWGATRHLNGHAPVATRNGGAHPHLRVAREAFDDAEGDRSTPGRHDGDERLAPPDTEAPMDVSKISHVFPFGVSRSRLARAIKHLGLPLNVARRWQDADGVLMLAGEGIPTDSSFLREARELGLPLIAVRGNTYGQITSRLSQLYGESDGPTSPRELAVKEARAAAQRVLAEAEPAELRPQIKPLRRLQHQLAEKYHLRSYSVGREPNRRVRFLPRLAR